MDDLKIYFFGPFSILLGDKALSEDKIKGDKQLKLVKYLILNRHRPVEKRELIDAVFGYGAYLQQSEAALNALNATLHRARALFNSLSPELKDIIKYSNGAYRVVLPENCEIDSDLFDIYSEKVFSSGRLAEIKKYSLKICEIYRGFFLDKGFSEEWARILAEKYHSDYKRIFSMLCAILYREKDFETLSAVSERASAIDPLCEDFRYERIRALFEKGEKAQAAELYRSTLLFFESSRALPLSEKFRELGGKISGGKRNLPKILSDISSRKRKFTVVPSSLFEEFAAFTAEIARKSGNVSLYLAEIKLREPFSERDTENLELALEKLSEFAIHSNTENSSGESVAYLLFGERAESKNCVKSEIKRLFGKNIVKISVFTV
ncbi:MAG: hypothetical protein E7633_01450 [Ruminococcaceae bacterium]|nr:hypothetical protein [Oscillospiraceae bacterium]